MYSRERQAISVDFGVVTALPLERDALLKCLDNYTRVRDEKLDIRTYYLGNLSPTSGPPYEVVIALTSAMGTVDAVAVTADMIRCWNPRYVAIVGIAGGIPRDGLALGDVVVADQVIEYEYTKELPERSEVRPRVHRTDALLLDRVKDLSNWSGPVDEPRPLGSPRAKPKLFIGPIASGSKIVASTLVREKIRALQPRILAIEMESEGVATAAWQLSQPKGVLVIRGVCDLADVKKSDDWQPYAAAAAATFFVDLLRSKPVVPVGRRNGHKLLSIHSDSLGPAEDLIATKSYGEAACLLAELVQQFPDVSRVRLLYALALLGGRNPDVLTAVEIDSVESHLIAAQSSPETKFVALIALAVVKHDFYLFNGIDEGTPDLAQILEEIRTVSPGQSDTSLLKHINATSRIKQLLNISW
jgi:nucleoside phosphorylase